MSNVLPREFADIEAVARPWAIDFDDERFSSLVSAGAEGLRTFHDVVFPRAKQIMDYCDAFDIRNPPDEVRALLNVLYSLIVVSSLLAPGSRRSCWRGGRSKSASNAPGSRSREMSIASER